jgi:hypothetical protein
MPAGRFFFFNMTDGLPGMSLRLRCLRSGAEIYKISGTRSVISLGLFIAAGYALSILIRRNEVTLRRRAKLSYLCQIIRADDQLPVSALSGRRCFATSAMRRKRTFLKCRF